MRTHVSDETLVDLMDGAADEAAVEHLRSCGECRGRLAGARAGMALALQAEVPEPSPLYWQAFQRQVGRRLTETRRPWARALWPALAAIAAGLAFLALPHAGRQVAPTPAALLPAWSPLPAADEDPGMDVLQAVAVHLEPEAECSRLEDCMADLSDEEGGALAEMMRREAPGRSS
jgi:hypothetical protein